MKKVYKPVLFVIALCFVVSAGAVIQNNFNQEYIKFKNDKVLLKSNPAFYYIRLALSKSRDIRNKREFDYVIRLLSQAKTASKNKKPDSYFPVSYFMAGFLYESKYSSGSVCFGAKGTPNDLEKAIKNYTVAANSGVVWAQNNLGEIFLDEINLSAKNKSYSVDVSQKDVVRLVPNLDKAIYWLTMAAKNGNGAAQGTLSDLYKQGIGVPQDFVKAYVWQNLCTASQSRYNKAYQRDELRAGLIKVDQKTLNDLYNDLTPHQKDEATKMLNEYEKKYFKAPSAVDKYCSVVQSALAASQAMHTMDMMKSFFSNKKRVR